ncbi:MAG: dihydrofolate reductase [Bacteroidia bacterium]|nr:dihydrofolate reductase [Bacteroidia bacterium]MCF8426817.1 dihydrofolate reductase [Bacteroidia bacterium]MCF8446902.1 dihydrofolate reductase [Bacteroidia bacterium]
MEIAMVVAADEANGIGNENQLLCHLPNDLKYFKRITSGHAVLMGRKTYDSIGKPLPNRVNLVISKSIAFIEGCEMFTDIPSSIQYAEEKGFTHLFIIGGDSIYKQALAYCNRVYLTRIHHQFNADAYFVNLPAEEWKLLQAEPQAADEKNKYAHTFEVYQKGEVQMDNFIFAKS